MRQSIVIVSSIGLLSIAFFVPKFVYPTISSPVKGSRLKKVSQTLSDLKGGNAFLDRRFLDYEENKPENGDSQFRPYMTKDVVNCLDSLFLEKKRPIHIAFVGDSIVRQHFLSFLKVGFAYTSPEFHIQSFPISEFL